MVYYRTFTNLLIEYDVHDYCKLSHLWDLVSWFETNCLTENIGYKYSNFNDLMQSKSVKNRHIELLSVDQSWQIKFFPRPIFRQ